MFAAQALTTARTHEMHTALQAGTVNTPRGTLNHSQSEHSPASRDGEHPRGSAQSTHSPASRDGGHPSNGLENDKGTLGTRTHTYPYSYTYALTLHVA